MSKCWFCKTKVKKGVIRCDNCEGRSDHNLSVGDAVGFYSRQRKFDKLVKETGFKPAAGTFK